MQQLTLHTLWLGSNVAGMAFSTALGALTRLQTLGVAFAYMVAEPDEGVVGFCAGMRQLAAAEGAALPPHLQRLTATLQQLEVDFGDDFGNGWVPVLRRLQHLTSLKFWSVGESDDVESALAEAAKLPLRSSAFRAALPPTAFRGRLAAFDAADTTALHRRLTADAPCPGYRHRAAGAGSRRHSRDSAGAAQCAAVGSAAPDHPQGGPQMRLPLGCARPHVISL